MHEYWLIVNIFLLILFSASHRMACSTISCENVCIIICWNKDYYYYMSSVVVWYTRYNTSCVWERENREQERIGMCWRDIICHSADTVVTARQNRNDTVHAFSPHIPILYFLTGISPISNHERFNVTESVLSPAIPSNLTRNIILQIYT